MAASIPSYDHYSNAVGVPDSVITQDALLQPDVLLPSQYYGGRRRHDDAVRGEIDLCLAILQNALRDLKYRHARTHTRRANYDDALEWFRDFKATGVGSLALCCELLGTDMRRLSEAILAHAEAGRIRELSCYGVFAAEEYHRDRLGSDFGSHRANERARFKRRRLMEKAAREAGIIS